METLLHKICVMNRDNGRTFTCCDRLNVIEEVLQDSKYRRIDAQGLFYLYAQRPLQTIEERIIVISTHVDVQRRITKCFSSEENDRLLGTYDNAITNAAVLSLMINDRLPENVVIAFTGDEEESCGGARQLSAYFKSMGKQPLIIVLDVTDMGWEEGDCFTVENNFWTETTGRSVISAVSGEPAFRERWHFVPSDVDEIPDYVSPSRRIDTEAEPDESWEYDEQEMECFSLCIPVSGEMHSDRGVIVLRESYENYIKALALIVEKL